MKTIPLTRGLLAIVDDEDFTRLASHKWFALSNGRPGGPPRYVAARMTHGRPTRQTILMHREVIGAPKGAEVDHVNRNPLDNRRSNLRLASRGENCVNRGHSNTLGFRGVHYDPGQQRFRAEGTSKGVRYRLGSFRTAEEAAAAYDQFARQHHGTFAVLNFDTSPSAKAA